MPITYQDNLPTLDAGLAHFKAVYMPARNLQQASALAMNTRATSPTLYPSLHRATSPPGKSLACVICNRIWPILTAAA